MSFTISGTGSAPLLSTTTALHLDVTTVDPNSGQGAANPTSRYAVGLIRFGDGVGYWPPLSIFGGPEWIAVPNGTTTLAYAIFGTGVVTVTEVSGPSPLSFPTSSTLEQLTDVNISSPSDGQLVQWNAAAAKWEAGSVGPGLGGALTRIGSHLLLASASSIDITAIPATFAHLVLMIQARGDLAGVNNTGLCVQFNGDTAAHYDTISTIATGAVSSTVNAGVSNGFLGIIQAATAQANFAATFMVHIANYARTTFFKNAVSRAEWDTNASPQNRDYAVTWLSTAAINEIKLFATSGNLIAGSVVDLYGLS